MLRNKLKGSYCEMGQNYGFGLLSRGWELPSISNKRLRLGLKCESQVERFFPEILEEIEGIADVCRMDYDKLAAFILTVGGPRCSVFAVTDGKDVFFGRNYDWYYDDKDWDENYLTMPDQGYWSLGDSDIFVGREDGVNERGLAIAMSGITAYPTPGINFPVAVRYVLDKCATVKEGVQFLIEIPHFCTMSYLMADASGDMAVVEASPQKTAVRKPEEDSFIVSTNHFVDPEMLDIRIYEPPDSRSRYDTISKMLKDRTGKLNEELVKSILSDHNGLICSHRGNIKLGTLWSLIVDLKNLHVFRAEGQPCKTEYEADRSLKEVIQARKTQ